MLNVDAIIWWIYAWFPMSLMSYENIYNVTNVIILKVNYVFFLSLRLNDILEEIRKNESIDLKISMKLNFIIANIYVPIRANRINLIQQIIIHVQGNSLAWMSMLLVLLTLKLM